VPCASAADVYATRVRAAMADVRMKPRIGASWSDVHDQIAAVPLPANLHWLA
jgi:hypothetical protein